MLFPQPGLMFVFHVLQYCGNMAAFLTVILFSTVSYYSLKQHESARCLSEVFWYRRSCNSFDGQQTSSHKVIFTQPWRKVFQNVRPFRRKQQQHAPSIDWRDDKQLLNPVELSTWSRSAKNSPTPTMNYLIPVDENKNNAHMQVVYRGEEMSPKATFSSIVCVIRHWVLFFFLNGSKQMDISSCSHLSAIMQNILHF